MPVARSCALLAALAVFPAAAFRAGVSPVRPLAHRASGFVRRAASADVDEFSETKAEVARIREELRTKELELTRTREQLRTKEALLTRLDAAATTTTVVYRETAKRSLVKALGWRFTAGMVTLVSSLMFTQGNLKVALAIVSSDFVSKSGTMFIGERLWNKSNAGRSKGGDNVARSFAKAIIWRLFAMVNTMCVSGFLTGAAATAAKIASFDAVVKTSLMVTYDQLWNRVDWGKELENVAGDGI